LHQEIIEFYNYISPSEEEHNSRMKSFIELKELLEREIENTEIKEFGSFASKLYLPNNDIDLVVIHKELNSQKLMMKVANVLWSYPERYTEVELIKHAKVPIIKMKD
jgi:non-canonical poly(A) RNA polymerase PAPD5/7